MWLHCGQTVSKNASLGAENLGRGLPQTKREEKDENSRLGRVWVKIELLDDQDIAFMSGLAVINRVIAWHLGGGIESVLSVSEER